MNKPKTRKTPHAGRLELIEKKCNLILRELAAIRGILAIRSDMVDTAIDRMHRNARRMKAEAERNTRILRGLFHHSNKTE